MISGESQETPSRLWPRSTFVEQQVGGYMPISGGLKVGIRQNGSCVRSTIRRGWRISAHAWNVARDRQLVVDRRDASQVLPVGHTPSWASSDIVRRQMQANRRRDTKPELALRSRVHELGLRYRVAAKPLPSSRRTADLVFTRARVAVFLDGCFWHGCPDHHRPARRNEEFWREKIVQNRERDEQTTELLQQAGWLVVRVWEHEDPVPAALRIHEIVSMRWRDATKNSESTLSGPEFPNPGSARSARSARSLLTT